MDPKHYIGYIRVSTQGQKSSGLGLEAQIGLIRTHVNRDGGELTELVEEVESGKKSDRPELARALARCRETGSTLILATLDRMGRKVHAISGIMESGIPLVVADSPNDSTFVLHIKAAMAEEEGRKISERTRAGLAVLKDRGVPLGAAAHKQKWTPAKAAVHRMRSQRGTETMQRQRKAFAVKLEDTLREMKDRNRSLSEMAEELNAQGHRTPRGCMFTKVQVRRMLQALSIPTDDSSRYPQWIQEIVFLHKGCGMTSGQVAAELNRKGARTRNGALWSKTEVRNVLLRNGIAPILGKKRPPTIMPGQMETIRERTERLAGRKS